MRETIILALLFISLFIHSQEAIELEKPAQSEVLNKIINSLLENDISLKKAHQQTLLSFQDFKISLSELYPDLILNSAPVFNYTSYNKLNNSLETENQKTISTNLGINLSQNLPSGGKIGMSLNDSLSINIIDKNEPSFSQQPEFSLHLTQPIWINQKIIDWDLLPSQIQSQKLNYEYALTAELAYRNQRIIHILKKYFETKISKQWVYYYERFQKLVSAELNNMKIKQESGFLTLRELWDQEIKVLDTELKLQEISSQYSQNLLSYKQITGFKNMDDEVIEFPELNLTNLPDSNDFQALHNLPVLKELKKNIENIKNQNKLTDLNYSPKFMLDFKMNPHYPLASENPSSIGESIYKYFDEKAGINYSFSLGLTIPLFKGGEDKHHKTKDKITLEQANYSYEETLLEIKNQNQKLRQQLKILNDTQDLLKRQLKVKTKRISDREQMLDMGHITPLELELAKVEKINSEIKTKEAASALFFAKMELLAFYGDDLLNILN